MNKPTAEEKEADRKWSMALRTHRADINERNASSKPITVHVIVTLACVTAIVTAVLLCASPAAAATDTCKQAKRERFWARQRADLIAVLIHSERSTTRYKVNANGESYSGSVNLDSGVNWSEAIATSNHGRAEAEKKYQATTINLNCEKSK